MGRHPYCALRPNLFLPIKALYGCSIGSCLSALFGNPKHSPTIRSNLQDSHLCPNNTYSFSGTAVYPCPGFYFRVVCLLYNCSVLPLVCGAGNTN